jgi:hypothetical protein
MSLYVYVINIWRYINDKMFITWLFFYQPANLPLPSLSARDLRSWADKDGYGQICGVIKKTSHVIK